MQTQGEPKVCVEECTQPALSSHDSPNLSQQASSQWWQPPSWSMNKTDIEEVNRLASCVIRMVPSFTSALRCYTSCAPSPARVPLFSQHQPPTTVCVVPKNRRDWRLGSDHSAKGPGPNPCPVLPRWLLAKRASPGLFLLLHLSLILSSEKNPGAEDCSFLLCVLSCQEIYFIC